MKKIKLKSLIDPNNDNIDDIYSNIVNELNLNVNNTKSSQSNKQMNKILNDPKNKNLKKVKDEDLLLSMTKRLNIVETQLKESNKTIKEKDIEIQKLKNKIKELEDSSFECENCVKMNKIIENQNEFINKLYSFFKENGIIIQKSVNDKETQNELKLKLKNLEFELNKLNIYNGEDQPKTKDSSTENHINNEEYNKDKLPKTIDIKTLARRIDEMNSLIMEENNYGFETEDGKIFKLKHRKEILISFYKNGLIIEGYQFIPYESETSQKILQDIIDGYSPFILKERYPDGVIMKVENHVKINYEPNKKDNNKTNIKNLNDPGEKKYLSGEEFTNLFPEKVIKNGKVLNIKEDMEKLLNVINPKRDNIEEIDLEKNIYELFDKNKEKIDEKDISKLQIKIIIINKTINVNCKKNMDINSLFEFIKKYVNNLLQKQSLVLKINNICDYGFIMAYPFKLINYYNEKDKKIPTIEEVGFHPSIFVTFDVLSKYKKKE